MKVLITGGEQGLGDEIATILDSAGNDVIIMPGWSILDSIERGVTKSYVENFIRDRKFDIVVNNFGINHLSWIGETPEEDKYIYEANVMVPCWVINKLVSNGSICRVLNISSQTYKVAQRTTALYCASKAAIVQMTKVMARELSGKGWVVNAYAPGKIVGTEMSRLTDQQVCELRMWDSEKADQYAKNLIPMERFMDVKEAAMIAVSILGMDDYVNGTVIEAFGGL